ncbi:MAG: S-methyl-5-thioribose-1-phosphate isomerase [Thermodesulfobacteriota bacterium]|nr:S-methyl-5-thioribose-1-phosphate isomerase [Thermodesulfobacteriota bacterium]
MKVDGKDIRPIWFDSKTRTVKVIDQRVLPHEFVVTELVIVDDVIRAIKDMYVRGAPLIGATGAFGVYISLFQDKEKKGDNNYLQKECERIKKSRPTAVNLAWGVNRVLGAVLKHDNYDDKIKAALKEALVIVEQEAENCRMIGEHGVSLIEKISEKKNGKTVNILTHCNAGWLACIEYGTATAPLYTAFDKGINIHVWVDETRPLNQGSRLTAWELGKHGIDHTIITDNAGGHLMQNDLVDMVIVGTDRTTRTGDVANKIGTYLKALAAKHNNIPFYVALPSSTFDWEIKDGLKEIPIETRDPDEIRYVQGVDCDGKLTSVLVSSKESPAANHAFDVTPAELVTCFITERGLCQAYEKDILSLFPEKG